MNQQVARSRRRIDPPMPWIIILMSLLVAGSAAAEPRATLVLDLSRPAAKGQPYYLPVGLTYADTSVTALVFSIDIDRRRVRFNPADDDGDGVPDSVTLPAGMPSIVYVGYDPDDVDGEIDVMLANLTGVPLPQDDVILIFKLRTRREGPVTGWIDFADDPAASFGNAQGGSVDGRTLVFGTDIFADGFESGDTSAWSRTRPGGGGVGGGLP